ncbi:MAG TPA: bifunctional demethylmenaquinone methyltransferase/2-methoxy-6-polyprenyl-1,4-benzoquinol methylase UbiE [Planctomycetota bacterium]|nr:bifunctional demethylmenaquinone methyltransferase/2-methoxy-6-polyprenyl-1,4-benzoquinol methylase UbiE [Planctomycetota bacterium]
MPDPRRVRAMFARIAPRYDLLNRVLSLGIDRSWRRALLLRSGPLRDVRAVDVCCGTGDVSLLLARRGARVVGVDFTGEMLLLAGRKRADGGPETAGRVAYLQGDATALPLADACADLVTIAFGIRNVTDRLAGLGEMARVLKPGGRLVILEFGAPSHRAVAATYRLYFQRVLPRVGAWLSGDREAYSYLPESVAAWPGPAEFEREIAQAGFQDCGHAPLHGGIAYLHWGTARGRGGASA